MKKKAITKGDRNKSEGAQSWGDKKKSKLHRNFS
jgi:hypothetical protein